VFWWHILFYKDTKSTSAINSELIQSAFWRITFLFSGKVNKIWKIITFAPLNLEPNG